MVSFISVTPLGACYVETMYSLGLEIYIFCIRLSVLCSPLSRHLTLSWTLTFSIPLESAPSRPEYCDTTNRYAKTTYSLSLDPAIATIQSLEDPRER